MAGADDAQNSVTNAAAPAGSSNIHQCPRPASGARGDARCGRCRRSGGPSERLAIASSATYQRGAHIIDPRVGHPTTALASATVVGPDLALADSYATIVFVLGLEGLQWLDHHPGYDGYIITHDRTTHWTPGFASYRRTTPAAAV